MSIPKVKNAVLKNLLIFGEKYLPQSVRLLWNAIWQNAVWTCSILTRGFPNHLLLYPSLTSFHKCKKSFGGAAYWEDPSLEVKLRLAKSNSQRFSPMMRALHHLRRRSTSSERRSGNRPALRPLTPPRRRHGTPAISRKPGQRGGGGGSEEAGWAAQAAGSEQQGSYLRRIHAEQPIKVLHATILHHFSSKRHRGK